MKKKKMIFYVLIVLLVVLVLVFITIKGKNNKMNEEQNINEEQVGAQDESRVVKAGDTIAVAYTGALLDGTVFDSNVDPKFNHTEPLIFTVGAGQMIPGFDKGVVGMKIGEKKLLTLAPEDAYGSSGAGDLIPPNATLTFDVQILGIK